MNRYAQMNPCEVRSLIHTGKLTGQTSGMCEGYAQANLLILPKAYAYDFLLFTQRNAKSCPVLEVTDPGCRSLRYLAKGVDLAYDFPKYRIYRNGVLTEETAEIDTVWRDDFVSFLIGCSFSFESALLEAGIPVRHIEEGKNVPMYLSNIDCVPSGIFKGKVVVSMRPVPNDKIVKAVTVTAGMPRVHGAPIHIGDPSALGIHNLQAPDFGDSVTIKSGETPVFWCCGVTPQAAVMEAKPSIAISHAPGHMLITDIKNSALRE